MRTKARVGRADLLRVLSAQGEPALKQWAGVLGYEYKPPVAEVKKTNHQMASETVSSSIDTEPPIPLPAKSPAARFFYVTDHVHSKPTIEPVRAEAPEWFNRARVLSEDTRPDPSGVRLPACLPLIRWPRLWPFLRQVLSQGINSRQPDIPRLIDRLSRGEGLHRIPLRLRRDWSSRICILLDYSRRAQPFRDDYNALCRRLARRRGAHGLDVRILHGAPGRIPDYRRPLKSTVQHWRMPMETTPLLILGDVGLLEGKEEQLRGWHQFGYRLKAAGLDPVVLAPVSAGRRGAALQRRFSVFEWDRRSRLRSNLAPRSRTYSTTEEAAESLLSLLAPAVFIEPALLRAIRYLLPAAEADVAAEAAVWQHPDVIASSQGFYFANLAAIEKYQQRFSALDDAALKTGVVRILRAHHAGLPESIRLRELAACARLAPGSIEPSMLAGIKEWERNLVKTRYQRPDSAALAQWLAHFDARQSGLVRKGSKELAALWALGQRDRLIKGESIDRPPEIRHEDVSFFLQGQPLEQPGSCVLRQHCQELVLERAEERASADAAVTGSFYTELSLAEDYIRVRVSSADEADQALWRYVPVARLPQSLAQMNQHTDAIQIKSARESLTISVLTRPAWALAIGRDGEGLFTEVLWLQARRRLYWQPPDGEQPGHWAGDDPLGVDETGLYADVTVEGVTQRFRWILSGTFLMGSPESEPERLDEELQHEVTLNEGFWLAETACTQALWQAVMGENPSEFKDDPRNPVEQVSWNDSQRFIAGLNRRLPGLQARLPTEAEWEYACRAGTTTPFSFGENITPEQVNYDGETPYAGGEKGLYRGHTVPVASLPPNPWGLYEMHGNVVEWCEDWYGNYPSEPQTDPHGPVEGVARVLRGGSWIVDGGGTRSAARDWSGPDDRDNHFGFRLALGQEASRGPEQVGQEVAAGQPRGRRGGQAERGGKSDKIVDRIKDIFKRK